MERLEYNELFVDGTQYTYSELGKILDNLKDEEVLELVEVDRHGNLHFEIHTYGMYCWGVKMNKKAYLLISIEKLKKFKTNIDKCVYMVYNISIIKTTMK